MAYNREWDKGKETWNDQSWSNDYSARGNVRGRDEEYYGEGKRRKFNDGVRNWCSHENVYGLMLVAHRAMAVPKLGTTTADTKCIIRVEVIRTFGPTMARNDMVPVNPAPT